MQKMLLRTSCEQNIHNLCKFPPICCPVFGFLDEIVIFFLRNNRQCVLVGLLQQSLLLYIAPSQSSTGYLFSDIFFYSHA